MLGFLSVPSKKRSREMEEEPFFNEDVWEQILRRVPLKQRTRLECVSKSWQALITYLRRTSPSTSGLAFSHAKKKGAAFPNQLLTLLDDQGGACSVNSSIPHSLLWLIDSCNGLLLFGTQDGASLSYHVFSPMKNQWIRLPIGHELSRLASASLAFDGDRTNFKVICQFWEEADTKNGTITYQKFSSNTWEWRENRVRIPKSALLLSEEDFDMNEWSCPSLYRKGKVYWIWSIYLLVLDEDEESFELMQLPKNKDPIKSVYSGKRIWELEGRLNYCDSNYLGFYIWDYAEKMWRPKHRIQLEGLVSRNEDVFEIAAKEERFSISPFTVKPCALNEELEILYLQLPGIIAAYSFESRKLRRVYSDSAIGRRSDENVYPFVFKAADLSR